MKNVSVSFYEITKTVSTELMRLKVYLMLELLKQAVKINFLFPFPSEKLEQCE